MAAGSGARLREEFVEFRIYEDHDIVEIPPPKPKPTRLPDGRIYVSSWTPPSTYEHRLNGKLVLRYAGDNDTGHHTGWSDGKVHRAGTGASFVELDFPFLPARQARVTADEPKRLARAP